MHVSDLLAVSTWLEQGGTEVLGKLQSVQGSVKLREENALRSDELVVCCVLTSCGSCSQFVSAVTGQLRATTTVLRVQ